MLARRRRSGIGDMMEQEANAGQEEKVWTREAVSAGCVCVCVKRLVVDRRPCDGQRMGIPRGDWHVARRPGKRGARRLGAQIFREGQGVMRGGHSLKAILCRWWRLEARDSDEKSDKHPEERRQGCPETGGMNSGDVREKNLGFRGCLG